MTTLAADSPRAYEHVGPKESYPVIASDIIYEGAAVGEQTEGYARPLEAGDVFLGFAVRKADNSSGSAGDVDVEVYTEGRIKLFVDSLAITSNDQAAMYASDDDTFTLTSTSNSKIGWVGRWISTGYAIIKFRQTEA